MDKEFAIFGKLIKNIFLFISTIYHDCTMSFRYLSYLHIRIIDIVYE